MDAYKFDEIACHWLRKDGDLLERVKLICGEEAVSMFFAATVGDELRIGRFPDINEPERLGNGCPSGKY